MSSAMVPDSIRREPDAELHAAMGRDVDAADGRRQVAPTSVAGLAPRPLCEPLPHSLSRGTLLPNATACGHEIPG